MTVAADSGLHHLLRIRAGSVDYGASTARLDHVSASNLANIAVAELSFDAYPAPQLEYLAGAVITAQGADEPFSPPAAYSITLSESMLTPGQSTVLDVRWRLMVSGLGTAYIERPVEVTILS